MQRLPWLLLALGLSCGLYAAGGAPLIDRLSVLRESEQPGFERADRVRPFHFPQDHGPHPAFRHEWWYLTGHLRATDGELFGFELTFFRLALAPPGAGAADTGSSAWRTRQLYAAHFAVTDVARGRFFNGTRYARDALGLGSAQAQPFAVHVADWSLLQAPADPESGPAGLRWLLQANDGDYALQLNLRTDRAPVLNGDAGLSRKADTPGAASYYYSMPTLQASGQLHRQGESLSVSGIAWLDREWSSGSLGAQQQGWDWFGLNFTDGSSLMFYALRDRNGRRDGHSAGTFIDAQGHAMVLANDDVAIEVLRHWVSARGGEYPAQWKLEVKSLGLRLQLTPQLADQELTTQPRYWEGAVNVTGQRGTLPVSGQGYVELVGYAQSHASATVPSASAPPAH